MSKIVFMGTPFYAVPAMEKLLETGHDIVMLICQPDKKQGRGHRFLSPATKKFALENNIEVYQPKNFKSEEIKSKLASKEADFFVVIAYGKILPQTILDLPAKGCINIHGSLLPKWRGAAPIQFSLLSGEPETGVCSMLMDEGMDTGDVLLMEKTAIEPDENIDSLSKRLSAMSADVLIKTIAGFDNITPVKQNEKEATYTRLITQQDRIVDWNLTAKSIYNKYRALSPKPGIFTFFHNKRLILNTISLEEHYHSDDPPGKLLKPEKTKLIVKCGSGAIQINSCQPENKKVMDIKDFLNGYPIQEKDFFKNEL